MPQPIIPKQAIIRRILDDIAKGEVIGHRTLVELWFILGMAWEHGSDDFREVIKEFTLVYRAVRSEAEVSPYACRSQQICEQMEQLVGSFARHHNIYGIRDRVVAMNHERKKAALVVFKAWIGEEISKVAPLHGARPPSGTFKLNEVSLLRKRIR